MGRLYSLIDTESANQVGAYRSEAAALRAVVDTVERYGEQSNEARSLALLREDAPSEHTCLARGRQLVKRAMAVSGRASPRDSVARGAGKVYGVADAVRGAARQSADSPASPVRRAAPGPLRAAVGPAAAQTGTAPTTSASARKAAGDASSAAAGKQGTRPSANRPPGGSTRKPAPKDKRS